MSKTETSWILDLSSQKDVLFKGELREPSFLADLSRDLFRMTNPSCVVPPFRVALIPCQVLLIFLDDILKQITRRLLKEQHAQKT